MSRIFYSKSDLTAEPKAAFSLFQEAVRELFPEAQNTEIADENLKSDHSFFFRAASALVWVEVSRENFSRDAIPDYLGRARRLEAYFQSNFCAFLAAPQFETGVRELLEFIRLPVRIFRYQVGKCGQESALWLEEISSTPVVSPMPGAPLPEPLASEVPSDEWQASKLELGWNRLTREELREFIQLELDTAADK